MPVREWTTAVATLSKCVVRGASSTQRPGIVEKGPRPEIHGAVAATRRTSTLSIVTPGAVHSLAGGTDA
jgi:hypothetical protein